MALPLQHLFFKTSLVTDSYDIEKITRYPLTQYPEDHLHISSRWDAFGRFLKKIFQQSKNDFGLDFLIDGFEKGYTRCNDIEETQIIFSLAQQNDIVKSLQNLLTIIKTQKIKVDNWDLSQYIDEIRTLTTEQLTSNIDIENEDIYSNLLTIELIKRFFEESIKEKMLVIKYAC